MAGVELARRVGVTPTTLWKWETGGIKQLTGAALMALAEALDAPPAWIENGGPTPDFIVESMGDSGAAGEVQA